MKRTGKKRPTSAKLKRAGIIMIAGLAFGLLTYGQIVRPNQHAAAYERQLDASASRLQACFERLVVTEKLRIFYAPDIPIEAKRQDIAAIKASIRDCGEELKRFNSGSQTLRRLSFSGYTAHYRAAQADQQHALNVTGQSSDVLVQYERLAEFLDQYYASLELFVSATAELNQVGDTSLLAGQASQFGEQGSELHRQAAQLRSLTPAAGFGEVIEPTAVMLDQAADGFDYLSTGYANNNDADITLGFGLIESAVASYNSSVMNLPFNALQDNYAIKQVAGLPDKVKDLHQNHTH